MTKQSRPVIGIVANVDYDAPNSQNIRREYLDAVCEAGGMPILIPLPDISLKEEYDGIAEQAIAIADGLLLPGGDDMNAMLYGAENMPYNGCFSEERDLFEIAIARRAAIARKPLLGICRGAQSLNVAMGGTLFQDVERENPGAQILMHRQKAPSHSAAHMITFAADSKIASLLLAPDEIAAGASGGMVSIGVNSFHHQAVREAAPGFTASAHSSDGIIEAIEPGGAAQLHPFTIGVQWHPERMRPRHAHALRLFGQFIAACRGD
jgi:putative glutamine amidotransferase